MHNFFTDLRPRVVCCRPLYLSSVLIAFLAIATLFSVAGNARAQVAPQPEPNTSAPVSSDSLASDSTAIDSLALAAQINDPDTRLTSRLQNAFETVSGLGSIEIEVNQGIVRLSGDVVDPARREQAVELARAIPGVLYIINDLETDTEIEARVTPAIERLQNYINNIMGYLPVIGVAILVLLFFGFLARIIDKLLPSFNRMGVSPMAGQLIVRILRALFWVIGLVLALDILGITALVGAVLGTAGLMGIAIGFAFKDIIENYLSGLLLSARRPFELNDYVKIDAEEGKVVRLTSRELILMTLDGNHVRIPNSIVFKSTIYNYTRNPRRRFTFDVGVDVEEDLQSVQQIGINTLENMKSVMDDPGPFALVKELGDFNVIISFFGWVDQIQYDFAKARSEAIRLVKNALDEAGVLMPEPIYNVRMQTVTKPVPASTKKQAEIPPESSKEGDVAVETEIEEQIKEDLEASKEPNLLAPNT